MKKLNVKSVKLVEDFKPAFSRLTQDKSHSNFLRIGMQLRIGDAKFPHDGRCTTFAI